MGRDIVIPTPHGSIGAWRADPPNGEAALGALVVLQEVFGVNEHIRTVADRYAAKGYVAVAPALFDPVATHVELGYDTMGLERGRTLAGELGFDRAIALVSATASLLQKGGHKVVVLGYCWGGSLAFLANARLGWPAVSYYGARTMPFLDEPLRAPMLFHFGGDDATTPATDIETHRAKHPDAELHVYPGAGHAFNRDVDPNHFHGPSALLAQRRTLDFIARTLG